MNVLLLEAMSYTQHLKGTQLLKLLPPACKLNSVQLVGPALAGGDLEALPASQMGSGIKK